jgi:hypothetical protein
MTRLQCPGCRKVLAVPEDKMGAMVACPGCQQKFRAGSPASRLPETQAAITAPNAKPKPEQNLDYEVIDDGEPSPEAVQPEAAVKQKPPAPAAPAVKPSTQTRPLAAKPPLPESPITAKPQPEEKPTGGWGGLPDEDEPAREEADEEEDDRPRKKKKKKKRSRSRSSEEGSWLPWAIGVGTFVLFLGLLAGAGVIAGYGLAVAIISVVMVIMIPISTVILILSMIISSALGGGIEFGEVHVVIPKAIGLLIVVTLVSLIPFVGWILTFPIWVIGLMVLFRLDVWEARFVFIINWLLNTIAKWVVFVVVIAALFHFGDKFEPHDGSDLSQQDPAVVDAACADMLAHPEAVEAKAWLTANRARTVLPYNHDESEKKVDQLYSDGAVKVTTFTIPVRGGQQELATALVVELPTDADARKKVFATMQEMQKRATKDSRQKYLLFED